MAAFGTGEMIPLNLCYVLVHYARGHCKALSSSSTSTKIQKLRGGLTNPKAAVFVLATWPGAIRAKGATYLERTVVWQF